jgi:hypothetical protein
MTCICIMYCLVLVNILLETDSNHVLLAKTILLYSVSVFSTDSVSVFSADDADPSSPSSSTPSVWTSSGSYHDDLTQLEPALLLLIQTTTDSMGNKQSVNFARKLADITLNFLYRLLQDAVKLADSSRVRANQKVIESRCFHLCLYCCKFGPHAV